VTRPTPARDRAAREADPSTGVPASRPAARHIGQRPPSGPYGQPGSYPMAGTPRPKPEPPTFLTVNEIAAMMRVSKMTVYRLLHDGTLASVRIGRSFRVTERNVRDYLGLDVVEIPLQAEG